MDGVFFGGWIVRQMPKNWLWVRLNGYFEQRMAKQSWWWLWGRAGGLIIFSKP